MGVRYPVRCGADRTTIAVVDEEHGIVLMRHHKRQYFVEGAPGGTVSIICDCCGLKSYVPIPAACAHGTVAIGV